MDKNDLIEHEILKQLAQSNDPVSLLRRYRLVTDRMHDTISRVMAMENFEVFDEYLEEMESMDSQITEFLFEEAAATLGHYDSDVGKVIFDNLPPGLCLEAKTDGFVVKNIPTWMLGHNAKRKHHPHYHNGRPFVRRKQLWYWLFHKLKQDYLESVQSWEESLIPQQPPEYAVLILTIRTESPSEVRDPDHFIGPSETLVNALLSNSLVFSDRPGRLSFAVEGKQELNCPIPVVDLNVFWSKKPLTLWEKRYKCRLPYEMQ